MNDYVQNFCRICSQCFCCVDCRIKHEANYHKVKVDCDICIYGKVILRKPTESILRHIQEDHFPVHCLYCKKIFKSITQLTLDHTCSAKNDKNQGVAPISSEENCDSPPITIPIQKSFLTSSNKELSVSGNMSYLTTSTPMQKCNEWNLEKISEVITPVDYTDNASEKMRTLHKNSTNITPITLDHSENIEVPLKRKVTFCETPIVNNGSQKMKRNRLDKLNGSNSNCSSILKNTSKESHNQSNQDSICTSTIWESALTEEELPQSEVSSVNCLSTKENIDPNTSKIKSTQDSIQSLERSEMSLTNTSSTAEILSSPKMNLQLSMLFKSPYVLKSSTKCSPSAETFKAERDDDTELYISSECIKEDVMENEVPKTEVLTRDVFTNCTFLDNSITNVNIEVVLNAQQNIFLNNGHNYPDVATEETGLDKILNDESNEDSIIDQKELVNCGMWSSVTNAWKTVLKGLSLTGRGSNTNESKEVALKRMRADDSASSYPPEKRVKIVDVKCRKTIHSVPTFRCVTHNNKTVMYYDKATQTG